MFGRLNRLLASALVAGVVLVLPPAALADCGGGPSAQNVYTECLSTGGGGKSTSHSGGTKGGGSGGGSSSSTSVPLSKTTAKALNQAGSKGRTLKNLYNGYGARLLQGHSSGPTTEPTAIGSAFDLGSGPTALLIVLAGTAVLLLAGSGMRVRRGRQRT